MEADFKTRFVALMACVSSSLGVAHAAPSSAQAPKVAASAAASPAPARAHQAHLQPFIYPDGAISILPIAAGASGTVGQGDSKQPKVDPYFANQALITALQGGLDVQRETVNWLRWLLPRQRSDGSFDRYCRQGAQWRACARADADDSTAATTIQLIALSKAKLPADVRAQAEKASQKANLLLQRLRLPTGTYKTHVDATAPVVEYLMDNAEVYAAFRDSGQTQRAAELKAAIEKRFRTGPDTWEPAYPLYAKFAFYPHALAYTYRWHNGLVDASKLTAEAANWMAIYGKTWLARSADPFPWGLTAWGMHKGAPIGARCWRAHAAAVKLSNRWTVLDQAADDALAAAGIQPQIVPSVCPMEGEAG
ncbi:MAG: hypothetical protein Q4A92_11085, partial [Corynebacterium sp.]|nr:hypothetical protein [Corynebacterium sp.]